MSGTPPPQDLDCPDPGSCTVAVAHLAAAAEAGTLPVAEFPPDRHWFRVYDSRDGYISPNPGFGDTRFAPFDAMPSGQRVPTLYLAETLEAALLETSLHNVSALMPRVIDEQSLLGKLHAQVAPPRALVLTDLRDHQLPALGLTRECIASSTPEHYPCTRRVARAIHAAADSQRPGVDGMVWNSRQTELTGRPRQDVAVIFADRVDTSRTSWTLAPQRSAAGALLEGVGRLRLDQLAEVLGVTVETADEPDY